MEQNTLLLPACYAVLSDEEMTYLEGGAEIPLFEVFGYEVSFDPAQFGAFVAGAGVNLFILTTSLSFQYLSGRVQSGYQNGLSLSGTFHHSWDKMNTWSKVAAVGVAGLAGIYVYSQVKSFITSAMNIYDQIMNPMPEFSQGQTAQTAAAAA